MPTNSITVSIFTSPKEAPHYNKPAFEVGFLEMIVVVKKGATPANPTVDLVFRDENSQNYVVTVPANILKTALSSL